MKMPLQIIHEEDFYVVEDADGNPIAVVDRDDKALVFLHAAVEALSRAAIAKAEGRQS